MSNTLLIKRLREVSKWAYAQESDYITEGDLMNKAADRIEELEQQLVERDALIKKLRVFELIGGEHDADVRRKTLEEAAAYLERDDFYNSDGMAAETALRRMAKVTSTPPASTESVR